MTRTASACRGRPNPLSRTSSALGSAVVLATVLSGCKGVLDPQGPVGLQQRTILLNATFVMLAIVIPVVVAALLFGWWFRESNGRARYRPDWAYSGRIELVVWAIPALTILFLGGLTWEATHRLDPARPLGSARRPVVVEVVSLDWKWLFIYPDFGIAAVNRLVVPTGTPVSFKLTSASVMNSFFVPQLGTQIYTMAGMQTQLHLQADHPGAYPGLSAQYSGSGFSDMRFDLVAQEPAEFEAWVSQTRGQGETLDLARYAALAKPSKATPPSTFGTVNPRLFDDILREGIGTSSGLCTPTRATELEEPQTSRRSTMN